MPHRMTFEFEDAKGQSSTVSLWAEEGMSIGNYEQAADSLLVNIAQILKGAFRGAKLCVDVSISAIDQTGKPEATSDVEELGEFIFESAAGFPVSLNIPGYDEAATQPNSDVMDDTHANVSGLISAMVNGVTLTDGVTVVEPVDIGGSSIDRLVQATERYRNSGTRR